jgi:hypothetical protein
MATVNNGVETRLSLPLVSSTDQLALASLRAPPGSPERRNLDAEYDQLQIERTKLRNALATAA